MSIHDHLKSAEGRVWTADDTAEVERVLSEIDRVAEAAVQMEVLRRMETAN